MSDIGIMAVIFGLYLTGCNVAVWRSETLENNQRIRILIATAFSLTAIPVSFLPVFLAHIAYGDQYFPINDLLSLLLVALAVRVFPYAIYYPWFWIVGRRTGSQRITPREFRPSMLATIGWTVLIVLTIAAVSMLVPTQA